MAENSKKSDKNSTTEETPQKKRCFVIMPFSDPEGYAPGHFRKIYEQIIEPAIKEAGFKPERVDENKISDQIIMKIFDGIINCEMAICDLSSNNPNVLYELGLRHAYDKPVVLIHDDRTNRIFDIQGISIIQYRSSRLYDEVIIDRGKISEAIIETEDNSSGYSIVNMINLKKATYDTNVKDTDLVGINQALLMRVINTLDKVEQIQKDFNKPIYLKKANSENYNQRGENKELEGDMKIISFQLNSLKSTINAINSINTSPEELAQIEAEILKLRENIVMCMTNKNPTIKQQQILDNRYDETESLLIKIKSI